MQVYSDPKRQNDLYSLPDVEVFFMRGRDLLDSLSQGNTWVNELWADYTGTDEEFIHVYKGWYWWGCLPGCLPNSDPFGPFETQELALDDAQADAWQYDDE